MSAGCDSASKCTLSCGCMLRQRQKKSTLADCSSDTLFVAMTVDVGSWSCPWLQLCSWLALYDYDCDMLVFNWCKCNTCSYCVFNCDYGKGMYWSYCTPITTYLYQHRVDHSCRIWTVTTNPATSSSFTAGRVTARSLCGGNQPFKMSNDY